MTLKVNKAIQSFQVYDKLCLPVKQSAAPMTRQKQIWWQGRNNHILIIWTLTVTLALIAKQAFCKTLTPDIASPYYVWLQKVNCFRRHHLDKHSMAFWTIAVTLNKVKQSFHKGLVLSAPKDCFQHNTLAHNDALPYQVWLQKVERFRQYPLTKWDT